MMLMKIILNNFTFYSNEFQTITDIIFEKGTKKINNC